MRIGSVSVIVPLRYNDRMETSVGSLILVYLALGGAAIGLLEFGVGALLWAEQKFLMVIGLIAALCGLYIGLWLVYIIVNPHLG
jgi:hypothetical protein